MEIWDVVIIGGGPAGLSASLYTSRGGLRTLILEKECWGGKVANLDMIENYPGFDDGISGVELAERMMQQAMKYNVEFQLTEVIGIELREDQKVVKTLQGNYCTHTVIVCSGSYPKKLGVPGEDEFVGRGVAYCAVCEGGSFLNGVVAVAGGGDSGITEGLYLSRVTSKVIIIEQMPHLNATQILQERARFNPKIEIRCGVRIRVIDGDTRVRRLTLMDSNTGEESSLEVDGLFVLIGLETNTAFLNGNLPLDDTEQIIVNDMLETKIPGCFAAGNVRSLSKRQVITAAGDGANAALSAVRYLLQMGR